MHKHLITTTLIIGTLAICGCSKSNDAIVPGNPQSTEDPQNDLKPTRTAQHYPSLVSTDGSFTLTAAQQASVRNNNAFALRLLGKIAKPGESTVFSPLSLTTALAFCADGASGQTREEIMNTLGLDDSQPNAVNELCATLIQNTLKADTSTTFNIANAFYLNSFYGFNMLPDYVERLHGYYDADIEELDFSDPATKELINAWGKRQTNGMIPAVLDELDPSIVACLLNAIYMEGRWQNQFQEAQTRDDIFNPGNGAARRKLPTMHQTADFQYHETERYQALRMKYGTKFDRNATFGMTIVLPHEGEDIADVLADLTPADLDAVAQKNSLDLVNVALPRFTTDIRTPLNDVLRDMGISRAFDGRFAQFNGIVRETNLYISDVFQKARIEVAEKGTKAAAITVIHMAATSIGMEYEPPKPIEFTADHPFLYFITESRTGTIYFIGQFCGK